MTGGNQLCLNLPYSGIEVAYFSVTMTRMTSSLVRPKCHEKGSRVLATSVTTACHMQNLTFFPSPHKGPILAPRPLTPKWTSLDLLWVVARSTCGALFPSAHGLRFRFLTRPLSLSLEVYFLSSLTRVFNYERNTIKIRPCPSSLTLGSSCELRRDTGGTGEISTDWLACAELYPPKTKKIMA